MRTVFQCREKKKGEHYEDSSFYGGISLKEVSMRTGAAILNSSLRQGYDAYGVTLNKRNLLTAFTDNEYDLAYLALHGEYGEDGRNTVNS